jgi:hypothetical protein
MIVPTTTGTKYTIQQPWLLLQRNVRTQLRKSPQIYKRLLLRQPALQDQRPAPRAILDLALTIIAANSGIVGRTDPDDSPSWGPIMSLSEVNAAKAIFGWPL